MMTAIAIKMGGIPINKSDAITRSSPRLITNWSRPCFGGETLKRTLLLRHKAETRAPNSATRVPDPFVPTLGGRSNVKPVSSPATGFRVTRVGKSNPRTRIHVVSSHGADHVVEVRDRGEGVSQIANDLPGEVTLRRAKSGQGTPQRLRAGQTAATG
jgi:hypothetical protein